MWLRVCLSAGPDADRLRDELLGPASPPAAATAASLDPARARARPSLSALFAAAGGAAVAAARGGCPGLCVRLLARQEVWLPSGPVATLLLQVRAQRAQEAVRRQGGSRT